MTHLETPPNGGVWTEGSIRPLTKIRHPTTKKLLPRRIAEVSAKIVKAAKDGPITAKLANKFVNDETGETQKAIAKTPTLPDIVKKERNHIAAILRGFEQIPMSEWDKVDQTLLKRFAKDLRDLTKFIES